MPYQPAALWDRLKAAAQRAQNVGIKAKLQAQVVVLDQRIKRQQEDFGMQLYPYLLPIAVDEEGVVGHPILRGPLEGPFVTTYKDNKALEQQCDALKEKIEEVDQERKRVNSRHGGTLSYEVPANSFGEILMNAPKNAKLAGTETKLRTDIVFLEHKMRRNKQTMGIECYNNIQTAEEDSPWVPSDEELGKIYERAKEGISKLQAQKDAKMAEIELLRAGLNQPAAANEGADATAGDTATTPATTAGTPGTTSSDTEVGANDKPTNGNSDENSTEIETIDDVAL